MKENRRSQLLINPNFQYKIIKQMFILMFVVSIIILMIMYWHLRPLLDHILIIAPEKSEDIMAAINQFKNLSGITLLMTFILLSIIFFIAGLNISNKIAGPLYNLQNYLDNFKNDKERKILKFREKDYFPELEKTVNDFIKRLDT